MKTSIVKQISKVSLVALALWAFSTTAQASTCGMSPDAFKDSQELAKKIAFNLHRYTPPDVIKVSLNSDEPTNILDHKFHKIDRSKSPFNQFDSVGIVTSGPYENKYQPYGTGVLISPCHVLTNRHVVERLHDYREKNENGSSPKPFSVGSQAFFSVGQAKSCDSKNDFHQQSLSGKVVDYGTSLYDHVDWAIIKLQNPVQDVKPARVASSPATQHLHMNHMGLRVGFPQAETQDESGFKNVRAQYVKGTGYRATNGIVDIDDTENHPGLSGSPIFTLNNGLESSLSPEVSAIYVGGGSILSVEDILQQMVDQNRGTFQDIKNSIRTGSCQ